MLLFPSMNRDQPSPTQRPVQVIYVPPGKASRPIPKLLYRLSAPLRWWESSTAREVTREIYMWPLRMKAVLVGMSELREGKIEVRFYRTSGPNVNPDAENILLLACSSGMRELQKQSPWSGVLDSLTYLAGFQAGVESAIRSAGIDSCDTSANS